MYYFAPVLNVCIVTFEQLLVKYLYQHKHVSLQGFGSVTLTATIPDSDLIHKNRQIAVEGASFEYNNKALTDEEFVNFFSQQRGKIKPLAISDIESHLQLAKQLMNIGKPYEVEGLGLFALKKDGTMELIPGNYTIPVADNSFQPGRLRERTEQQEKNEAETASNGISSGFKKGLLIFAVLIALGMAGWFIWSQFLAVEPESAITNPVEDSIQQANALAALQDSLMQQAQKDSLQWRAYFRSFVGKERVNSLLKLYNQNPDVKVETTDSTNFRLYILLESPVSDTAFKIDSLKKIFLRPITLEKVNP